MSETQDTIRLSKLARELNVGISTLIDEAEKKGIKIENNPNTKLSKEVVQVLEKEFAKDKSVKEESKAIGLITRQRLLLEYQTFCLFVKRKKNRLWLFLFPKR